MKIGKIIFLSSFFFFICVNLSAHPFYVSICQVDFNEQNQSLEVSLKIFADDLVVGLRSIGGENLYLGEERESKEVNYFIEKYVLGKLSFYVDNKPMIISYLGKEMENDVVWCFLEVTDIKEFDKLKVENEILTEIYNTQSNIINVTKKGITKSLLLNIRKPSGIVEF